MDIRHYTIDLGLHKTAVVMSDFHLPKSGRYTQEAIHACNAQQPDMVFLLGDFAASRCDLSHFSKIQCEHIFAVLGNHDYNMPFTRSRHDDQLAEYIVRTLEDMGVHVLRDSAVTLDNCTIVGVDSLYRGIDEDKAFAYTDGLPIILLSHNPDIVLNLHAHTDLILSGHTHGGTMRLPGLGQIAPISNTRLGRKFDKGFKEFNKRKMIITSGIGDMPLVPRLFNPPEIVVVEL